MSETIVFITMETQSREAFTIKGSMSISGDVYIVTFPHRSKEYP